MARTRQRVKGRMEAGTFFTTPKACMTHPNYARLSARAVKLLFDLYAQYKGGNNGDFTAAYRVMRERGWTSKDQLNKARRELLETGWIVQTRQGGRNQCSLYAVTFQPIDECKGKNLDVPATITAPGTWKGEIKSCAPSCGAG